MIFQEPFTISSQGRGSINIDRQIQKIVAQSGVNTGLCHVFVKHTSASLMLCENADPSVRRDLEYFMANLVKDGDPQFEHQDEGPDDMSAHIRTIITHSDLQLPISQGRLNIGIWQGVFLWEHRTHGHTREVLITVQGE